MQFFPRFIDAARRSLERLDTMEWLHGMCIANGIARLFAAAGVVAFFGCATQGSGDTYDAFLQRIAADCKPLIIGSDNMGEAITFNGVGALPVNYTNFLTKTEALYRGGISPQIYRDSLTAFVGTGSYNARSFDCIVAHLPSGASGGTAPAK